MTSADWAAEDDDADERTNTSGARSRDELFTTVQLPRHAGTELFTDEVHAVTSQQREMTSRSADDVTSTSSSSSSSLDDASVYIGQHEVTLSAFIRVY